MASACCHARRGCSGAIARSRMASRACGGCPVTGSSRFQLELGPTDGRVTVMRSGDLIAGAAGDRRCRERELRPIMTEPVIAFENVVRTYGRGQAAVHALAGVNFEVVPGRIRRRRGALGSGKSTPMNILGCLDLPTRGLIYFAVSMSARSATPARSCGASISASSFRASIC